MEMKDKLENDKDKAIMIKIMHEDAGRDIDSCVRISTVRGRQLSEKVTQRSKRERKTFTIV